MLHVARVRGQVPLVLALVLALFSLLALVRPVGAIQASLSATLTGAAEAPGPGDPDGWGVAYVDIDSDAGELCYGLFVEAIATATAAHIHVGPAGSPGPVVVPLAAPADGSSEECLTGLDSALLAGIAANPASYYVNVHNADYPGGAVRGQLMVAEAGDCALVGAVDPDEDDLGSDSLAVTAGQEVTFWGWFMPGPVDVTLWFGATEVETTTMLADAEGYIEFSILFEAADIGAWSIVAAVPETECAGEVAVTVSAAAPPAPTASPAPTAPPAPTATPAPTAPPAATATPVPTRPAARALPNTATSGGEPWVGGMPGVLAVLVVLSVAGLVMGRARRAKS